MKANFKLVFLFWIACLTLHGQDPLRFEKEVNKLVAGDSTVNKRKLILFTGSSSIRLWKTLEADLQGHNVLNRGFGGSETTDLIYYFDKLIPPNQPKQIFIYEGDNDLASGKTPDQVMAATDSLLTLIRTKYSKKVRVVFITPKPSISRWRLKDQYVSYVGKLKSWAKHKRRVAVADVWTPLLDDQGKVMHDIFMDDNLHLNAKGYAIWTKTIRPFIR